NIFDVTAAHGLYPNVNWGGGHISVDTHSAFGTNTREFVNFITDFSNHPEIAIALYNDPNGPPMAALSPRLRDRYAKLVMQAEKGRLAGLWRMTIDDFREGLMKKVYRETSTYSGGRNENQYYQALNVTRADRIEIRSVRAQLSADEWIKEIELFEKRILYL